MALPDRGLLLDVLKGSLLTAILFLSYVTFPFFGLIAGFFAPLPAFYYQIKSGTKVGFLILAVNLTVFALVADLTVPILYVLQAGFMGFTIPWLLLKWNSPAKAIAVSVGVTFLLAACTAIAYGIFSGIDIQAGIIKGIELSSEQAVAVYGKQGLTPEEMELFTSSIRQAASLMGKTFPALLFVALGHVAVLNTVVIYRLKGRLKLQLPEKESFITFRNTDYLVWVVIAAGFSMFIPNNSVTQGGLNVLIVCGFIYFIQGMAVTFAFFQRASTPSIVRLIFWLALIFQPYIAFAVAVLGLFDTWGNFRTPKTQNL